MKYKLKHEDGIVMVSLSGNVMGGPGFEPFHNEIKERIAAGDRKFLFDFGGVKWINSTGVGIMVTVHLSVQGGGGKMAICRPNERVRGTYMISQVNQIFQTFETVEEGVTYLMAP